MDSTPPPVLLATARPARLRQLATRHLTIFACTVLLPTLAASLYYGLIASDVYVSESRFVVRSPQQRTPSGLGALLQGAGFSRSQDDTYSVHDYVRSRDALKELDQKLELRRAYSLDTIDFFNRFPGLDRDDSFEAFHRHYLKHVSIDYDSVSSISVLTVRAYAAGTAQAVNESLLHMGERLVNNLNERSRRDLIEVARAEVRQSEDRAKNAALALSGFRAGRNVVDPTQQSTLQLQGVARLQEELLAAQTQLAQLQRLSPRNPQIGALSARIDLLRKAVASESAKVTGSDGSLMSKSPAYDRLVLEKAFADRQLASALGALDAARADAARKQLYLERLVQPHMPDRAVEPRRVRSILTVFVLGLVLWGVVSLVVSSVKEHAE